MAHLIDEANRDRFLTVRWNNALSAGLGIPGLLFAGFALFTSGFSDRAAFIGIVLVSAFY